MYEVYGIQMQGEKQELKLKQECRVGLDRDVQSRSEWMLEKRNVKLDVL